jgi:hypothetical protein
MHPILEQISRNEPGRYLTVDELKAIVADEPYLKDRANAALAAQAAEQNILDRTIKPVLKRYDFVTGRAGYGPEKCYRDVGAVYRYCVFAMLCDDPAMLKNKLLYWMRTIIQALNFPAGNESIKYTYDLLRKESGKVLPAEHARLLDPFLQIVAEILPSTEVPQ